MARTIADLAGAQDVRAPFLAEAIQYRVLDAADQEVVRDGTNK